PRMPNMALRARLVRQRPGEISKTGYLGAEAGGVGLGGFDSLARGLDLSEGIVEGPHRVWLRMHLDGNARNVWQLGDIGEGLRDLGGHVAAPALDRVAGNDAQRSGMLPGHDGAYGGQFISGARIGLDVGGAARAEIAEDEVQDVVERGGERW